jgi:hypothetical protein
LFEHVLIIKLILAGAKLKDSFFVFRKSLSSNNRLFGLDERLLILTPREQVRRYQLYNKFADRLIH